MKPCELLGSIKLRLCLYNQGFLFLWGRGYVDRSSAGEVNELGWEKITSLLTSTWNIQSWMCITNHNNINGTCNFVTNRNPLYFHIILQLSQGSWNSVYAQQCFKIIVVIRSASRSCLLMSLAHMLWVGRLTLVRGGKEMQSSSCTSCLHKARTAGKSWLLSQDWPPYLSFCFLPLSLTTGHLNFKEKTWSKSSHLVFCLEQHCPISLWTLHGRVETEPIIPTSYGSLYLECFGWNSIGQEEWSVLSRSRTSTVPHQYPC